jgi:hypothetical protein
VWVWVWVGAWSPQGRKERGVTQRVLSDSCASATIIRHSPFLIVRCSSLHPKSLQGTLGAKRRISIHPPCFIIAHCSLLIAHCSSPSHSSLKQSTGLTRDAFSACIPTVIHEIISAIAPAPKKYHQAREILNAKSSSQSFVRK